MKTLIVGNGVIGTIYGWALSEAGVDVTHFLRPGKITTSEVEVQLDVLDERKGHPANGMFMYRMRCVQSIAPEDHYDLIIVPVNADQLDRVLQTLVPVSGQAIFLTMTSNWDGTAILDAHLPAARYLLGYADGGGTIRDGRYWVNLGAEIHLGQTDLKQGKFLSQVKALFERADMQPDIQTEMLQWLWVHNASAVGFAAGFAKHKAIQHFLKDGELMKTCIESTRELLSVCEHRGANLKDYPEISFMNWPNWLVLMAMRWLYTTNKSMQRYTAHAASAGSLRETRMNYEAMLQMAEKMGIAMPATRALGVYLS
jgi:2-dehydropantoate 2-reductase